ncbi:MAG: hypothetical protein AAGG45_03700 [Pseudomonadota bacterium]
MKTLLKLFILLSLFIPVASAESVTARDAVKQLSDRGAIIGDTVLIYGEPMISAKYQDQGYRLVLSQCVQPDYACKITIFSACQMAAPLTATDLISFANEQNKQATARGTMYADRDRSLGDVICIRSRRDLHREDVFDMTDVFVWHTILGDFSEAVETEKRRITVRDLLGVDEETQTSFAERSFDPKSDN